jgi:hypothetical protein
LHYTRAIKSIIWQKGNEFWLTCYMISYFAREQEKRFRLNSSIRIITYLVLEIVLDQYLHNDIYTWQYINDSAFLWLTSFQCISNPLKAWSRKFWYPNLVGSFTVSQRVFWYTNGMRDSANVILGSHKRHIIIDNLM